MTLPGSAKAWIGIITMLGGAAVLHGVIFGLKNPATSWGGLLLFIVLAALTDAFRVKLARFHMSITVSTVIAFGGVLAFGPAAVVLALGSVIADSILRKPVTKSTFNAATYAISIWCSAYVWIRLDGVASGSRNPFANFNENILPWVASGLVFVMTNTVAVVVIVALADRSNMLNVVRKSLGSIVVQWLTLPTLGWMVMALYQQTSYALLILAFPVIALYYSLRSVESVRRQTLESIEKMSHMLDARDPATERHSERVAGYVELMCDHLSLPADLTEITVSAAKVHDLGKIAVPDAILFKPGRLTAEEWQVIKTHPERGAELLGSISAYNVGANIVRHHHERWDGKGYPYGLAGEEIPLGARIIAVADAYDVMTTNRVYRSALHADTALEELMIQSGNQFDPTVVDAFLRALGRKSRSGRVGNQTPAAVNHQSAGSTSVR